MAEKIGLGSVDGWALFESGPGRESHIPGHHYLYDVISSWEMEQVHSVSKAKLSPNKTLNKGQQGPANASGASDNRFIFKKRLYKNTREIPGDTVEVFCKGIANMISSFNL